MNQPTSPNKPNTNPTTTGACGNCNLKDSFLLHNVRVRGVHRRLCTSCVLRAHPSSFCPYCFDTTPPPPSKRISCSKCTSLAHSHCATLQPPPLPFLCPPCADPNFTFFTNSKTIDKKMATVLLCAAKIAANSMAKAVTVARTEAERRVREAAVCRKRAREALEHLMFLANPKPKPLPSSLLVHYSASANNSNNTQSNVDKNSNTGGDASVKEDS